MKNKLTLLLLPVLLSVTVITFVTAYIHGDVTNNNNNAFNKPYSSYRQLTPSDKTVTISYNVDTSKITEVYGTKFSNDGDTFTNTVTLTGNNNLNVEVPFTRTLERKNNNQSDAVSSSNNGYVILGNAGSSSQSLSFYLYNLGVVKNISVNTYDSKAKHTLHVYVGGNNVSNISLTSTGTYQRTINNINLDGDISLVIDSTEGYGTIYFKSITIEYYPYYSEITDNTKNLEFSFARYMNVKMNMSNVCSGDYSQLESMWNNVSNKYSHYRDLCSTYDEFDNFFKGLDSTYGWTPNLRDDFSWAVKTYDVVISIHPGFTAFIAR